MKTYLLILFALSITSYVYLKLAIKYKIIDKPNERSSHTKITVRGGGIVFTIAMLLFFFLNDYQYPYFMLGVLLISVVSFLDDIFTLSSKIRFPFQFLAVFLILFQVGVPLSPFLGFSFLLILGVGIVNMFNFMDGINGLTGMYSAAVLSGLYFVNLNESIINSELIIYSFLAVLVFGFYNFRKKALFFAGDIGSIAIGMLIFFLGLFLSIELKSPLIILLVVLYGADASYTLLYRKFFTKENIFDPHRSHIYQKLVRRKKISHLQVAVIYSGIQICINFIVFKSYKMDMQSQLFIFAGIVAVFTVLYVWLFKKLKT
ncbi:MAG: UDP-GlcNAc:undecaprenyl-phosphate GlcNAc-1-phosphate transferase [Flavobacteriaceae bacterium]|jgi:UDP-GlcNAc:undecaprenyl-phosphate GlcNAc-1-phosphate transferase